MSHQTGATFAVLLFQTTELMNPFKQPRPAQAINNVVPTFQARERRKNNQSMCGFQRESKGVGRRYLLDANTAE